MNKLKRVVIKEELVKLTGDYRLAIVLNQMIYWSERVRDFDKFIEEEKKRILTHAQSEKDIQRAEAMEPTHGWIYKKAEELSEETMMNVSKTTMGKYLDNLVEKGWLEKRRNPRLPLDKTYQYRVNISKIQGDLLALGYNLDGYPIDFTNLKEMPKSEPDESESEESKSDESKSEDTDSTSESKNETSKSKNLTPKSKNLSRSKENGLEVQKVDSKSKNETAIPEITPAEITDPDIISEITDHHPHQDNDEEEKDKEKVVVVNKKTIEYTQDLIRFFFNGAELPLDDVKRLLEKCIKCKKGIYEVVKSTYDHYRDTGEPINSLAGSLMHGVDPGWRKNTKARVSPGLEFGNRSKPRYTPYNWVKEELKGANEW